MACILRTTAALYVALAAPAAAAQEADVTTVAITDQVVVRECSPLGIMLGGDAYYSGAALVKDRARANFEGTSYRQCPWGPAMTAEGLVSWYGASEEWRKILPGADVTLLSGPAKGTRAKLVGIEPVDFREGQQTRKLNLWRLDRPIPPHEGMSGILVDVYRLNDGQFRRLDGYWTSKQNHIATGDTPPGSFGVACACLDASTEPAHLRFSTAYQRYAESNGTWRVRFWAKARSGAPRLRVACDRPEWGEGKDVPLTAEWQRQELRLTAGKVPEPQGPQDNPHLLFLFRAEGGEVLLDDVEIVREGDANPTAFRDDVVAMLRRYGTGGPLRNLQMGGNTLRNTLMPPIRAHSFSSEPGARVGPNEGHNETPYSLHQLYELCEHVGVEPWYCIPGTLSVEEVRQFMEYLGAPADTGFGKIRAELGHPKPWTETFRRIHVEFGNEAWNNAGPYQIGGYNGPDYWRDLIAAGKASPHYAKSVLFHAAGQAASSGMAERIMRDTPNADRYSVAPYIIQSLTPAEVQALDTDDKLFRWVFAWPLWRARNPEGAMFQNAAHSRKSGIEMSVYEINHHITHGEDALEQRNRIVTSLGGGLNVANTMLVNLKEHGARAQVLFSLLQHSYSAQGIGGVRLWGTALNMRAGQQRFRPTFLACALANKVIGGDLVATTHTGADPTFDAAGIFSNRRGVENTTGWPALLSYAFADGKRRGVLLLNLDTTRAHPVSVAFAGRAQGGRATSYLLASESIADNNEFENPEPKVRIVEETVEGFASGARIAMPAHSMRGLVWDVE